MNKFTFNVDIVAGSVDRVAIVNLLTEALANLTDVHSSVRAGEVKRFSEQGYKVWRARKTGVTVAEAGDAANPKANLAEVE